jgi:hypothetical protein
MKYRTKNESGVGFCPLREVAACHRNKSELTVVQIHYLLAMRPWARNLTPVASVPSFVKWTPQ